MVEVEVKANIEKEGVEKRLALLGIKLIKREHQIDTYFDHSYYNFKKKDEALRVRETKNDLFLTYKGKKLDEETKTRREIEIKVEGKIYSLLKILGFFEVEKVEKIRDFYQWNNLKICLDKVKHLGEFLEIEGKRWKDKKKIFELLKKMNIKKENLIRKSYLELLKKQD
ncbi:class IV adenylate cyclase [Candidatus Aerophobetes bacterium]|nr:class IV adenylate cyclase [Candidatus Aerophobetes bacterium]